MDYREATAADAAAIAGLHADSWRRHYRGAYLDSFLDGDVIADRMAEWADRLSRPAPDRYTVVADLGGAVAGFAPRRRTCLLVPVCLAGSLHAGR
jgi:hypothetical protein